MSKQWSGPALDGKSPAEFWDGLYEQVRGSTWTAQVNARLAGFADGLTPGAALDLGCGQGGDALWLARRGWQVTAVDIAEAAVERVAAQATAEGLSDRVTARRHDLSDGAPEGEYDLISALYLQTPFEFPRERVLHETADRLRPGGRLLVVDHASSAPWSWSQGAEHPTPDETLRLLDLPGDQWETLVCTATKRAASGPAGQTAEVIDNVIGVRRRA